MSLTTKEIKNVLLDARTDVTFEWHGLEFYMYHDQGQSTANTDKCHIYDTWDQLLKAPIFWGKTLAQIADDTICNG